MRKSHSQVLFAVLILLAGVPAAATDVRLFVPDKIYAVPSVEMNVCFNNIVTVINPANCDDKSIRRCR